MFQGLGFGVCVSGFVLWGADSRSDMSCCQHWNTKESIRDSGLGFGVSKGNGRMEQNMNNTATDVSGLGFREQGLGNGPENCHFFTET